MIEVTINQALVVFIGFVVTGFLGFLVGRVKHLSKIERARIIIDKASARAHVLKAYERYVIKGEHMTIARYDELNEEYEAYVLLGGNGTAKSYMNEIRALKPYLVID